MAQWVKNPPAMQETQEMQVLWTGKMPWRRKWQPTPVFLPGKSHCVSVCISIYLYTYICICALLSRSVMSNSLQPHGLQLARLLCPWGFSRPEYWNGLPCPPPGDLPNQGLKPGLPYCRWILYCLSHQGSPIIYVYTLIRVTL